MGGAYCDLVASGDAVALTRSFLTREDPTFAACFSAAFKAPFPASVSRLSNERPPRSSLLPGMPAGYSKESLAVSFW